MGRRPIPRQGPEPLDFNQLKSMGCQRPRCLAGPGRALILPPLDGASSTTHRIVLMVVELVGSMALHGMSIGAWLPHFIEPVGFLLLSLFVAFSAVQLAVLR